jgi:hypothetical protein
MHLMAGPAVNIVGTSGTVLIGRSGTTPLSKTFSRPGRVRAYDRRTMSPGEGKRRPLHRMAAGSVLAGHRERSATCTELAATGCDELQGNCWDATIASGNLRNLIGDAGTERSGTWPPRTARICRWLRISLAEDPIGERLAWA